MKRFDVRIIFGFVLTIIGSIFLLENLGILHGGFNLLWAILIASAGAAALYVYAINRENWWALIPGCTLTAIGLNIALGVISPQLENMLGGGIILGGIALAFWMVFFTNRSYWWAIIPAGILSSIAVVDVLDSILPYGQTDGLFLIGFGMTFLLLGFLPGYDNQLKWAFIPGGILTLIGVLSLPFMEILFNIIWPLLLIGAGGYVIYKNFRKQ
ncbi:MAG: hypothetical protein ISR59_11955 [Anaerolineales bacterium]|uniref:DUF5668 domain-containing protein n=1 Tax=Candidatus Desulfolinea nitratireducens TaxID=2841698 RepID=A0A8J6NGX4_9CHLR|nr:hypothetical protein [Candidatus Desulfolinea nitratireducens]MBL6961813.1 hypothetical protein [Anaerolineales bacterium]